MTRIIYETESCSRCGGSGSMPYAAYGGVCFKCHGKGSVFTRRGLAAYRRVQEVRTQLLTVPVTDLQPGQRYQGPRGLRTVESVTVYTDREEALRGAGVWTEGGIVHVITQKSSVSYSPGDTVVLNWTPEAFRAAVAAVSRMSGATVTEEVPA